MIATWRFLIKNRPTVSQVLQLYMLNLCKLYNYLTIVCITIDYIYNSDYLWLHILLYISQNYFVREKYISLDVTNASKCLNQTIRSLRNAK